MCDAIVLYGVESEDERNTAQLEMKIMKIISHKAA